MSIEGPRAARREELPAVLELSDSVFRAGEDTSMAQEYPLLFNLENLENLRLFLEDGRPVSLVGMCERDVLLRGTRHRACCIGSVCTDPDYRGQGLATRLLKDARAKAVRDGCDLFFISGGRGLYRRQGYVDVGGYRTCGIPIDKLPPGEDLEVRPWKPADVPDLVRIHAAEPVRFARGPDDFLKLLRCGHVVDAAGRTMVVCGADGEPVAYFAYQRPGAGDADDQRPYVREFGGPRCAVTAAFRALFAGLGARDAKVDYLAGDEEMNALAAQFGWPSAPRGFHGTVGIIDAQALWDASAPLFRELLGIEKFSRLEFDAEGGGRLSYGKEELRLGGMGQLTRLVFLPSHRRQELELDLGPGSELARVLERLFPLPLVDYGLNFI